MPSTLSEDSAGVTAPQAQLASSDFAFPIVRHGCEKTHNDYFADELGKASGLRRSPWHLRPKTLAHTAIPR